MPVTTVEELIQKCTQLIERDATVAGVGKRMRNPLLSVFLGRNAQEHMDEVQSTYFSCWSAPAQKLTSFRGVYTREMIEDALVQASTVDNLYQSRTTLQMVWYWDIMDDDFDQHFACVDMDINPPMGMQLKKTIFIFCSQRDTASQKKTRARLDQLIQWGAQRNQTLILFSDATMAGLLSARGISESYHMAASLILMLNSQNYDTERRDMAAHLDFSLRQEPLWTMSYRACGKNFFDIIGVSLVAIIDEYQKMGNAVQNNNGVQARVCGENRDYIAFLDEVFENVIMTHCPDEQGAAFWADLPYTDDIAALERQLSGQPAAARGWNIFKKRAAGNADNAIPSLGEFWNVCVDKYYVHPVRQWLATDEGYLAVKEYIYGKMTAALTLNDMRTQLPAEWNKLEREQKYQDLILNYPIPETGISLSSHLHACACVDVKCQIYSELLFVLNDIMKTLHAYAGTFTPLLNSVSASLSGLGMDHNIHRAYGNHMKRLVQENQHILNRKLRPCGTEAELLEQLGSTFAALLQQDPDGIYHYNLQDDINFQMKAGVATAANNIIETCFKFQLKEAGRLVTSGVMEIQDGLTFCIMNDSLRGLIPGSYDIGTQFIVNRCDRIERLCVYPVQAEAIS